MTTSKQEIQYKNWCFTMPYDGVYTDDKTPRPSLEKAQQMIEDLAGICSYLVAGKEVCPTTGTKHFQGYLQLEKRCRRGELTKLLPRTHFEPAKGDDEQNYAYCTKEEDFLEYGERSTINGGKREQKRWKEAREAAIAGDMEKVPDQIFVQHYQSVRQIQKDYMIYPPGLDQTCGVWIHGEAGVGKSFKARQDYPEAFLKQANKWWDGYRGQANVIMDDLDKSHACLGHHLKIWMDSYPFTAEIKGGAISIRPVKFVITSQYAIEEIWQDQETIDAIRRRCKVVHMIEPFKKLTEQACKRQPRPEFNPLIQAPPALVRSTASMVSGDSIVDLTAPDPAPTPPPNSLTPGNGTALSTTSRCDNGSSNSEWKQMKGEHCNLDEKPPEVLSEVSFNRSVSRQSSFDSLKTLKNPQALTPIVTALPRLSPLKLIPLRRSQSARGSPTKIPVAEPEQWRRSQLRQEELLKELAEIAQQMEQQSQRDIVDHPGDEENEDPHYELGE
jgi:hypothetical protein